MGVALYYTARRAAPLTLEERGGVAAVVEEFNATAPLVECAMLGIGAEARTGEILAGSIALPLGDIAPPELQELLDHWLAGISALRGVLPSAAWDVRLDDLELPWFGETDGYQLSAW